MEHGLFVDGELIDTHENQRFLQALADAFDAPAQVVTLRQPATVVERQMYAIAAYMAKCPNIVRPSVLPMGSGVLPPTSWE